MDLLVEGATLLDLDTGERSGVLADGLNTLVTMFATSVATNNRVR
jgi:hypothetical protein